jgi:CBS domain-containing protein
MRSTDYRDRSARRMDPIGPEYGPRNTYPARDPYFGTARNDYRDRGYGVRQPDREDRGRGRGFMDRAADEVMSWFGDEDAERRRRTDAREEGRRDRYWDDDRMRRGGYERRESYRGGVREGVDERRIGDVMTPNVVTVRPDTTLVQASRLMRDEDCGALPVVDANGRPLGMITDRDIVCRAVADGEDPRWGRVRDCMTDEVFACRVYGTIDECLDTMSHHQVRRLLVLDDRDRVVGIVSQADLATHIDDLRGLDRRRVADVVRAVSEPTDRPYR